MTTLPHHDSEDERHLLGTRFGMRSDQDVEIKITLQQNSHSTQSSRGNICRHYHHFLRTLRFNLAHQPKWHPWRFQSRKIHDILKECHNDCDDEKKSFLPRNHVFLNGYQCNNNDDADDDDIYEVIMASQKETRKKRTEVWITYWKNLVKLFLLRRVERERIFLPKYWSYVDQDDDHHDSLHCRKKGKRGITSHYKNELVMPCLSLHVPTSDTPTETDDDCSKTVSGICNLGDDFPLLSSLSREEERNLDMRMKETMAATCGKSYITETAMMLPTKPKTMSQDVNVDVHRATPLPSFYPPHNHIYPTTTFTRIIDSNKKGRALKSMSLKDPCDKNYEELEIFYSHQYSHVNPHDTKIWHNTKGQNNLSKDTTREVSTPLHRVIFNHHHQNLQQQNSYSEKAFENNIWNHVTYPSIYLSTKESFVSALTTMTDDSNQDGYENAKSYQGKSQVPNLLLVDVYPFDEPLYNEEEYVQQLKK